MAIASPAVIKDARSRQRRRWIAFAALAAAVAVTATWGAGGFTSGGGSGVAAVLHGSAGWTLTVPTRLQRRLFDIRGFRWEARGVTVGNFSPLPVATSPDRPQPIEVPTHGVLFQLYTFSPDGPVWGRDAHFPLTLRDFPGLARGPKAYVFSENGYGFLSLVAVGHDVSRVLAVHRWLRAQPRAPAAGLPELPAGLE